MYSVKISFMKQSKFPIILLAVYAVFLGITGISPYDRQVWIAELVPIMAIVLTLVISYKYFKFSNFSYIMMSVLIFMHTIGGHYTFERVPFGFITDLFDFHRNHYDRVAHFSVGFYAFALAELLMLKRLVTTKWILYLFPVFAIFTVASVYEILEWYYASTAAPEQGVAFLGSQGDIWDAQKDMLSDGLGAIFAVKLFSFIYCKKIKQYIN